MWTGLPLYPEPMPEQKGLFKMRLQSVNVWYGPRWPRRGGTGAERPYHDRGGRAFEWKVALLHARLRGAGASSRRPLGKGGRERQEREGEREREREREKERACARP